MSGKTERLEAATLCHKKSNDVLFQQTARSNRVVGFESEGFYKAPRSGREVRDAIRQGCRNAFDGISEQTRNLRDRGSNLLGFKRRKAAGGEYQQGAGI